MNFRTRRELAKYVGDSGYRKTLEVGVANGWFSREILASSDRIHHTSIDPWCENELLMNNPEKAYEQAKRILRPFGARSNIVRGFSPEEASKYDDGTFDFIYIDALHRYEPVLADMRAWWPKLRIGGMFAGHDYSKNEWPGVYRAVQEFSEENGIKIVFSTGIETEEEVQQSRKGYVNEYDGGQPSWFFFKDAPKEIPGGLLNEYTLGGSVPLIYKYDNQATPLSQDKLRTNFTVEKLRELRKRAAAREANYYGDTDRWLYEALGKNPIDGHEVLLVGSTCPWYEAVSIEFGCCRCTVLEYSDRPSIDERIYYVHPEDMGDKKFDTCISVSSFEHDGLGRYGDPLDPTGDLKTMRRMKDFIKPGGLLFLSVPVGSDKLFFNLHRVYGRQRLPLLLDGWKVLEYCGYSDTDMDIDGLGHHQPVFVLTAC